jgi:hypothetical protein
MTSRGDCVLDFVSIPRKSIGVLKMFAADSFHEESFPLWSFLLSNAEPFPVRPELERRKRGNMTEPVYRWQPITDAYKEEAMEAADIEAEQKKKRQEINAEKPTRIWAEKKTPLGIKVFTWYYFGRAGICALLLLFLASFPQSSASQWTLDGIGNFLHMPGSKSAEDARRKQIEQVAQENAIPENAIVDEQPEISPEAMHTMVMVYLLVNLVVGAVVGFMWWNHSWKVRWVTMFYAGALVGKALINFIAGAASGVGSGIGASEMPMLTLVLGLNGLIFLYLAFGPGVKQWFEEQG